MTIGRKRFPTDKKEIDRMLYEADAHGVTRKDFLRLTSASAVALAAAPLFAKTAGAAVSVTSMRSPQVTYLTYNSAQEYIQIANATFEQAAPEFGFTYSQLSGKFDSSLQYSQAQQQDALGVGALIVHSADGADVKPIAELAGLHKVFMTDTWGTLVWYTPFDANEYYVMYAYPDDYAAMKEATEALLKAMNYEVKILRVSGIKGNATDIVRTRGADAAIAPHPKATVAAEAYSDWTSEGGQKTLQDLISRVPDFRGVIANNDDMAIGCLAALQATGNTGAPINGVDGTNRMVEAIAAGKAVATGANVPAYFPAFHLARLYDVTHGWTARAGERMMNWKAITLTKANVGAYIARYVDNAPPKNTSKAPFNYKLMSKVLHPTDWDMQAEVYPMDIDVQWEGVPKPSGYKVNTEYLAGKKEWPEITTEYAAHYKIPLIPA
jgi:ABC-type sugar transport system substrate-binding protein